ncbi:hypothetical protein V3G39_02025 [Dermatophilaceae bacterium Sec6.4]
MRDLTLALAGPPRHGVRLHAEALLSHTPRAVSVNIVDGQLPELTTSRVHLHFTDALFGSNAVEAAERVRHILQGRAMTVTLHDLPQASDGPGMQRRQAGYARVASLACGIQVSSAHERELLQQTWRAAGVGALPPVAVVPLPVDRPARWATRAEARDAGRARGTPDVVVLGFVYPGKGHEQTLLAMRALPPSIPLIAVGAASSGHDDLLTQLERDAAGQGRRFECTGYVSDAELEKWARRAVVPVCAHTHISASGSINRWISSGRRPIVTPGRYVAELAQRAPWAVTVAPDLPAAIAAALGDPASTWITEAQWDDAALPDTRRAAALQLAAIDALGPIVSPA